ncbi:helix-turn-helix domain-containing protein [Methylobacterium nodulans]|uniref:Transcriptional regulator, Crp/Fnr family n=1 Tax=Methylobacterium nodulans (strain LMG 21967 / CNCM I-2342 / ORS 2060) TaxID=460265 RepID=B8IVC9_METNO|nr:helix-turn-helix domain-containing protein [Methylobacterium nodulans]ACL60980.1 transcriptional regulator, Crp/Fnr family [Methylobacterium nodulans ORS 2060]
MHPLSQTATIRTGTSAPPAVLGRPTLASIFLGRPVESFEAGETVFWQGEAAREVFELAEGCLRLCRILPDGRRVVTGFIYAGAVVGVAVGSRHDCSAEAVTPVRLRRIDRRAFHAEVDRSDELRPQLLAMIQAEVSAAQAHIIMLGCKTAEERVATFLVTVAQRTGADLKSPVQIQLPMTRRDIADFLGLTLETVSRIMSKFKRDGLIAPVVQRTIRLRRMQFLQELTGEFDEDDGFTGCPRMASAH